MGTSFFPSRSRCCDECPTRRVSVGQEKLTEYYHRGVVAHLVGFDIPVVLDVEMVRPGESEIVAARRLLVRLLVRYRRFFDAVVGDALYFEAPLLGLCRKHGKHLLAVLKDNNPALLTDARALLQGEPDLVEREEERRTLYWDQEGFRTDSIEAPVRVLRSEQTQTRRQRIARRWVLKEQTSTWYWATSIPRHLVPRAQLCRIGHQRWQIENRIFNALAQHWGLDHCYYHEPTAILNFILILLVAYTLVATFHQRNIKPTVRRRLTLIAVARQIFVGVLALTSRDVAWLRPPARCAQAAARHRQAGQRPRSKPPPL